MRVTSKVKPAAIAADPFRCRIWRRHDRFASEVNERTCKAEIDSFAAHDLRRIRYLNNSIALILTAETTSARALVRIENALATLLKRARQPNGQHREQRVTTVMSCLRQRRDMPSSLGVRDGGS